MKSVVLLMLALGAVNVAWADVQVKYRDVSGNVHTMRSDGNKVRINGGQIPGYLLLHSEVETVYLVDKKRQEVVKLPIDEISGVSSGQALNVGLKSIGGSDKIAGYKTGRFNLIANGQLCGTLNGSSELIEQRELKSMLEAMQSLHKLTRTRMAGLGVLSECQQASTQLSDLVDTSGFVLRYVDEKGKTLFEVTSIKTDKEVEEDYYEIPAGMEEVDMNAKLDQAKQLQDLMSDMDDDTKKQLQDALKQLQ